MHLYRACSESRVVTDRPSIEAELAELREDMATAAEVLSTFAEGWQAFNPLTIVARDRARAHLVAKYGGGPGQPSAIAS